MKDYLQYTYKLETHLKVICDSNEEYTNLYATWNLNKKTYKSVLKTVVMNYPHYSLHDDSHSESIITNIEMLLGEDRIKRLSPTETWMILQCAYLHDFGMALLSEKAEKEWKTPEFKAYLEEKKDSTDKDIVEAIKYINELKDNLQDDKFEEVWPLKIRKYVTFIIADYFRSKHSSLTKEYLDELEKWEIDISHNNLIPERLIKLIGEISFLHTQDFNKVMKLNYESNGYKSDYIHPRFIAEMIRVGDLLDLDNGRFSSYVEKVIGGLPKLSKEHKEKHQSTRHVLITPSNIEISADCPGEEVYRETRSWFLWLDEEIKNLTMNWTDIIPNNLTGYPPKLIKKEILLNGRPDLNNIIDLRFNISQEKAFDIIEGSNIYEDRCVFVREFIQNALDASKIRLWRDLKSGTYDSWLDKDKELKNLNPFDISKDIYNNYEIEVIIKELKDEDIEIVIKDRGIGISLETLKAICNVGTSYNGKLDLKKEINEMPSWLRPTGGFGIGLQSGFLVTDKFKAYSHIGESDTIEITFESRKSNGYIQVRNSDRNMKRGTEFYLKVEKNMNFSFQYGGYVAQQLNNSYDPILNDNLFLYKIVDSTIKHCDGTIIPIKININNKEEENLNSDIFNLFNETRNEEDKYIYNINNSLDEMDLWIKEENIYLKLQMKVIDYNRFVTYKPISNVIISYKGIKLEKESRTSVPWVSIYADIYGMNTKESLKLSRDQLTKKAQEQIDNTVNQGMKFYIEKLKNEINKIKEDKDVDKINQKIKEKQFDKCAFIILASIFIENFRASDYKFLLGKEMKILVMKRGENNFKKEEISFIELLDEYPDLTYINIDKFMKRGQYDRVKGYNYEIIEKELNKNIDFIEQETIVVDKNFIEILQVFKIKKIQIIESNKFKDTLLYSINNEDKNSMIVDKKTENYLIKLLVPSQKDRNNYGMWDISNQRSCVPTFSNYDLLAIKTVPFGISVYNHAANKMISPVTRKDRDRIQNFKDKESFIQSIIKREDYKNLLDYIMKKKLSKKTVTEKQINELYIELIGRYFELMKTEM